MFEQTLLTQPASAQKTGAFAMSLTAQMCVLGVLIVGPLLYTQTLPLLPPKIDITFTPPAPPLPPVSRVQETTTTTSASPLMTVRRAFVAPATTGLRTIAVAGPMTLPEVDAGDFAGPVGFTGIGDASVNIGGSMPRVEPLPARTATVATAIIEPPAAPVQINTGVLASKLITKVVPEYPAAAKAVHAAGVVRLLAIVGVDGHVKSLRVLEGHPLLRRAAEDAVRQWIYSPTYLSGRPVEVEAAIEVNFALN
jgi:protein TonB